MRPRETHSISSRPEHILREPLRTITASHVSEVRPAVQAVESAVAGGLFAVGYVAFEAAAAFEPRMPVHPPRDLPLVHFQLYPAPPDLVLPQGNGPVPALLALGGDPRPEELKGALPETWRASLEERDYRRAIERIREHIAAGDTYQVNFTFPLQTAFTGDALSWFRTLSAAQGAGQHVFLDTGRFQVLSVSPELFFSLDGETVRMKPMKGTRPRGRWAAEDAEQATALAESEKDRAENLMIVDMVRNDLGRIARGGTVRVERLFEVERYETVWQMTSTVRAKTAASVPEIFAALFPAASVTGAPKIETMKIIHALEHAPRGVYCGAVGWWAPGRQAHFRVGIRTAVVDRAHSTARYSVGSGITWDSAAEAEYQECLDKAAVLSTVRPPFALLETVRYEDGAFHLLAGHLKRMRASAAFFGFAWDENAVRDALEEATSARARELARLRLLLERDGAIHWEWHPLPEARPLRVTLAKAPAQSTDVFLFHKTTHREVYEAARAAQPEFDDVLLYNEHGELTESTLANIVVELAGENVTPPLDCGLLGGVFRAHLLETGALRERVLRIEDLRQGKLQLINSVRGWIDVELVD